MHGWSWTAKEVHIEPYNNVGGEEDASSVVTVDIADDRIIDTQNVSRATRIMMA